MPSLARFILRRRWWIMLAWAIIFIVSAVAAQLAGTRYSESFSLPHTDSAAAMALLGHVPGLSGASGDIVFHSTSSGGLAVDQSAVGHYLEQVARLPQVARVSAPTCTPTIAHCVANPAQLAANGATSYAIVTFNQDALHLNPAGPARLEALATGLRRQIEVNFTGQAFGTSVTPQHSPAEAIGLVVAAAVLLLAFGSLFAMLLPLIVALFAVGTASSLTGLLSHVLSLASFAPILGSLIGLGVGIDYALFIVTRTRQDLRAGASVEAAVSRALDTSGRAVLFAGATVVIALLGMVLLRLSLLSGVAVSASITVGVTVLAALTLLPALLGGRKARVLSRREHRQMASTGPEPAHLSGPWSQWAGFVARHAKSLALVCLVILATLAWPLSALRLGNADQGSDPAGSTTRVAYDQLASAFGPGFNGPLTLVAALETPHQRAAFADLHSTLSRVTDVAALSPTQILEGGHLGIVTLVPASSPQSDATANLLDTLRSHVLERVHAESGLSVHVGGLVATYADFSSVLGGQIPLFIAVVVLLGCLLLMVAFRSLLIPLVAAAMNLLAAGAAFGLVTAVFQWGWGASLLGSGAGPIDPFLPVIMIAILFGLSMDYQVFLVSRMHEEWLGTGDNEEAIRRGQATTGRVITAAALIMVSVFLSFAFGGQRIIAEFGVGLGGAVLLDAFVIRTVLVPSLMHFLGRANWWMPAWLERIIPHVAVEPADHDLLDENGRVAGAEVRVP